MTKPLRCKIGRHKYNYENVGIRVVTGEKVVKCTRCGKIKVIGVWGSWE